MLPSPRRSGRHGDKKEVDDIDRGGEGGARGVDRGREGRLQGRRWCTGEKVDCRGGCRCRLIILELFELLQFTLRGGVDRVVKPAGSSLS